MCPPHQNSSRARLPTKQKNTYDYLLLTPHPSYYCTLPTKQYCVQQIEAIYGVYDSWETSSNHPVCGMYIPVNDKMYAGTLITYSVNIKQAAVPERLTIPIRWRRSITVFLNASKPYKLLQEPAASCKWSSMNTDQ